MKKKKLGIGSFVRYGAPNGSTGRVSHVCGDGRVYVDWVYGRDVNGDVIKSKNSPQLITELSSITRKEYQHIRDGKAFGR